MQFFYRVTTCVVVWIEIQNCPMSVTIFWSPPAWWCGVKYTHLHIGQPNCIVTTCVVVWIEICAVLVTMASFGSHHLRGGVD